LLSGTRTKASTPRFCERKSTAAVGFCSQKPRPSAKLRRVAIVIAEDVEAHIRTHSGGIVLHVTSPADAALLAAGLKAAVSAILQIPHPEEPSEPYASFVRCSATEIHADMPDAEAYDGVLDAFLNAVVDGLASSGVTDALIEAGPDRSPASISPPAESARFELPATFPMPPDAEVTRRDDRFVDDGGLDFTVRTSVAELLERYRGLLPAAGFVISELEPVLMRAVPFSRSGVVMRFSGGGWAGTLAIYSTSVHGPLTDRAKTDWESVRDRALCQLSMWSDLPAQALSTASVRRWNRYDWEANHAALVAIRPDLPGEWIAEACPRQSSAYCFCSQDSWSGRVPTTDPCLAPAIRGCSPTTRSRCGSPKRSTSTATRPTPKPHGPGRVLIYPCASSSRVRSQSDPSRSLQQVGGSTESSRRSAHQGSSPTCPQRRWTAAASLDRSFCFSSIASSLRTLHSDTPTRSCPTSSRSALAALSRSAASPPLSHRCCQRDSVALEKHLIGKAAATKRNQVGSWLERSCLARWPSPQLGCNK